MHVSETDLLSLLDGELDDRAAGALEAHLSGCAVCAERMREMEALVSANRDALDRLDPGTLPRVAAADVIERARRVTPLATRAEGYAGRTRFLRAAVVAFLVVAAAAAAAIPGSPVREMISRATDRLRPPPVAEPATPGPSVAVEPAPRLVVVFAATQAEGAIEIRLEPGPRARVAATGGNASFSVRSDSITVDNAGSAASYVVTIPPDVPDVAIRVGGVTIFEKSGDDVRALAPVREGHVVVPFASLP